MVVKYGSVSRAAQHLGVHRATVLRHVDALEKVLGVKLFIRHSHGYLPTEVGLSLLRVAKVTQEQFNQFAKRAKAIGGELEGDFVISSIDAVAHLLLPALKSFQKKHPKIKVCYLSSEDKFKLEYGQAHVAIRTGTKPVEDDYVCLPFINLTIGLYAHVDYIAEHGEPENVDKLEGHYFIGNENIKAIQPMYRWLRENIHTDKIVFRSSSHVVQQQAVHAGLGIGFFLTHEAAEQTELVQVLPEIQWKISNWIVTHGDLHRTEKIQSFLSELKESSYLEKIRELLG